METRCGGVLSFAGDDNSVRCSQKDEKAIWIETEKPVGTASLPSSFGNKKGSEDVSREAEAVVTINNSYRVKGQDVFTSPSAPDDCGHPRSVWQELPGKNHNF